MGRKSRSQNPEWAEHQGVRIQIELDTLKVRLHSGKDTKESEFTVNMTTRS